VLLKGTPIFLHYPDAFFSSPFWPVGRFIFIVVTPTPRTSRQHSVKTCSCYPRTEFDEVIFLFSIELLTVLAACHEQSINDLD